MGDVIEEQQAIEAAFMAVIANMEGSISASEDGTLTLGVSDAGEIGADPDIFQQLVDSLAEANVSFAEGELALGDVNLTTPEVAVG